MKQRVTLHLLHIILKKLLLQFLHLPSLLKFYGRIDQKKLVESDPNFYGIDVTDPKNVSQKIWFILNQKFLSQTIDQKQLSQTNDLKHVSR